MATLGLISMATTRYKNILLESRQKFQSLNVLIGPNGSGKTNAIRLLQFLKSSIVRSADDSVTGAQLAYETRILGGARMLDRGVAFPSKIDIAYEFVPPPELRDRWASLRLELGLYAFSAESPVTMYFEALSSTSTKPRTDPYFYYRFHDQEIGRGVVSIYDGPEKHKSHYERLDDVPTDMLGLVILHELLERFPHPPDMTPVYSVRRQLIDYIKKWHFYNSNDMNFEDIRTAEPKIGPPDIYLSSSGNNLALVMENLIQGDFEFEERLNIAMKSILPRTRKVRVVRTGLMGLAVEWYCEDMSAPFYLSEMSDGTVRMLCWATILLSPRLPTLLVIDEPEMGIHPSWLPALVDWIKAASQRTQVIISTHSPDLLDHFTDFLENVICFSTRDGNHFTTESLSRDRLESKLQEGWQLGDLYRVGDPLVGGWPW
ncbi:MAG: AAA family ATPase [Thermodesulfobacteriota bacterium]